MLTKGSFSLMEHVRQLAAALHKLRRLADENDFAPDALVGGSSGNTARCGASGGAERARRQGGRGGAKAEP